MKRLWAWWCRLWFAPVDPAPLAMFRISLALFILLLLVALAPSWEYYYAADGILSLDRGASGDPLSLFTWTEGWLPIRVYWVVGIVACFAMLVGWRTRVATITLYVLEQSILRRNWTAASSEEVVLRLLLFYGCLAPLGACWSLDARRRRTAARQCPAWPLRLLQINVAFVYVFSVLFKVTAAGGDWLRGDAIYWAMMDTMWARWPWPKMFYGDFGILLSNLMTYGTILIEGAFPILVWFRRTRWPALTAITLLHVGIALAIPNVKFYSLIMLCAFVAFIPASTLRDVVKVFRRRFSMAGRFLVSRPVRGTLVLAGSRVVCGRCLNGHGGKRRTTLGRVKTHVS